MGVLASWRTPDDVWLVDQMSSEPVDWRVWREVDGHILVAALVGPREVLREYLAQQGVNLDDLEPAEDEECE